MSINSAVCFSPRVYPRPQYPPFLPLLRRTVFEHLQFPAFACAFAWLTAPLHVRMRICFDGHMESWGYDIAQSATHGSGVISSLVPWVAPADLFFCLAFSLTLCSVYVMVNGFFWLCDERKWLQRYKCPRSLAQQPSDALVRTTIRKELFAHFITAPFIMIFILGPLVRHLSPECSRPDAIPRLHAMFGQFLVCLVINKIGFYWGHRLLHTRWLYKNVHSQHHSYIATRSFAAEYAHMFEDVSTAYIPFLLGLLLTKAHFHVICVYFFCQLIPTYEGHSGYCFYDARVLRTLGLVHPLSTAHHDYHHTRNAGCFGHELLDWLFGTMDAWVQLGGARAYMAMKNNIGTHRRGVDNKNAVSGKVD